MNLVEPEILAYVLILVVLCVILTVILRKKVPDFKANYQFKFNSYIVGVIIINAVIALLGYNRLFTGSALSEFVFYQVGALLMGGVHCYVYRHLFNKFGGKTLGLEYLFIITVIFYCMIPFTLIYTFLNGMTFAFLMMGQYIIFLVPTLVNETFNRAMNIPPEIYKTWQFPENYKTLPGVTDEEMKDLMVFTLLIDKDRDAKNYSAYKAKGPTRIDFGRLFYSFVLDYNEKHSENELKVEGENGFYNWVFFLQPKWYETTKYVDADLPLYMNGIEENSVVICTRAPDMIKEKEPEKDHEAVDYEYK
ncbi:TssN family type VI secretion system protein [Chryseobacterium rhizoplanae]|uniref:TssN family type VI secretion system protein n=1 Tax=Chryseobacterium rhizoplanae TaxID=1609531 RepID=UPI001CE2B24A|nr:TssN family type VI secretion system protein [Chryseobacterium rhizoplanae]UCA61772.1 TssN family type VI secretion system protein [Chryseobacterium rhizoplanae]